MHNDITSLNFTMSTICSAKCVYCPRVRAREISTRFMSPEIVEKVMEESSVYNISTIDVGESADSFLNPKIIDILRIIRARTQASVRMFTNFRHFKPDKIDIVLEEELLDKVITNIDGATPDTYYAVKGLNLEAVESNILYFLKKKEALNSSVYFRIQSLTLNHYIRTVKKVLGRNPLYVPEKFLGVKDDFKDIVAKWEPRGTTPQRSFVTLWAEADGSRKASVSIRNLCKSYLPKVFVKPCRLLDRIKESFFVMPSGEVYLCCADFNFELIVGNVAEQTVKEIVEGERRKNMIEAVSKKDFEKIGGPCLASDLCRIY